MLRGLLVEVSKIGAACWQATQRFSLQSTSLKFMARMAHSEIAVVLIKGILGFVCVHELIVAVPVDENASRFHPSAKLHIALSITGKIFILFVLCGIKYS